MKWLISFLLLVALPAYAQFSRSGAMVGAANSRVSFYTEEGATVGADVVVNGDFAATNSWIIAAGVTIDTNSPGKAVWTGNANLRQNYTFTDNDWYEVVWTISDYSSGAFYISGWSSLGPYHYAAGTYRDIIRFIPPLTSFFVKGADTSIGSVSSVQIRPITPTNILWRPLQVAIVGDSIADHQVTYGAIDHNATSKNGFGLSPANIAYLDYALGSTTVEWAETNSIPRAIADGKQTIIIHSGVNDIQLSRTWPDVVSNLNNIATLITTQDVFISQMIPWTSGSDAQNLTRRTWNTNFSDWCATNTQFTLIPDAASELGTNRASTGELDDIYGPYNVDGIHIDTGGTYVLWQSWLDALTNKYGIPIGEP